MAFGLSATQNQTRTIQQKQSVGSFFSNKKRKRFAIGAILVIAVIGAWFIFKSFANPNTCQVVDGGGICDVDQVIGGEDTILSRNEEALNLGNGGWGIYSGTTFRAPNFPQNGALPLTRLNYEPLTMRALYLPGDVQNALIAQGAKVDGVIAYAWPDNRQPGTVPVYAYERSFPGTQVAYTTDHDGQGAGWVNSNTGWVDKGVAFYAYPPTYVPPAPASAPATPVATKDTNCTQSNLVQGESGECVKVLKGMLIGLGANQLNKDDGTFDKQLSDVVSYSLTLLKNAGKTGETFSGTVTLPIWQAFELALDAKINPPPAPTTSDCPNVGGDAGLKLYLEGAAAGKTYNEGCNTLWRTYFEQKQASDKKAQAVIDAKKAAEDKAKAEAAKPVEVCPDDSTNQAVAFEAYKRGVNQEGKKYDNACHAKWIGYGQSQGTKQEGDAPDAPAESAKDPASDPDYCKVPANQSTDYCVKVFTFLAALQQAQNKPAETTTADQPMTSDQLAAFCKVKANQKNKKCVDLFNFLAAIEQNNLQTSRGGSGDDYRRPSGGGGSTPSKNYPSNSNPSPTPPAAKGWCKIYDTTKPDGDNVPLVATSGYSYTDTRAACISAAQTIRLSNGPSKAILKTEMTKEGKNSHCRIYAQSVVIENVFFSISTAYKSWYQESNTTDYGVLWAWELNYVPGRNTTAESCISQANAIRTRQKQYNVNNIKSAWEVN